MFSHHTNIRTSDSHLIYDTQSVKRLNTLQNVINGNHVWITPETKIRKGCKIGGEVIVCSNVIISNKCSNKNFTN